MTLERKIARSPQAIWREIDGQVAIVSIDQNRVRLLNKVGGYVWERCDGATVSDLVGAVTAQFRVEQEQAQNDVAEFIADLETRGLIHWVPSE